MQSDSAQAHGSNGVFQDRVTWYFGVSAYWFATSFKWFLIIGTLISGQLAGIVKDGEKNGAWGTVFMVGAIWALFGPALFGSVSDRFHSKFGRRKPFLVYGTLGTLLALAVLAFSTKLWMFVVGYLMLQVADDLGTGPYAALIPEIIPSSHRGRASSVLGLLRLIANICGGLTAYLLPDFGYTYLLIGVIQVLSVSWVLWLLKNYHDGKKTGPKEAPMPIREFFKGWAQPWKRRDFRLVWLLTFVVTLGFYMVQPYLKNYLMDVVRVFDFFGHVIRGPNAVETAGKAYGVLGLVISLFGALGAVWSYRVSDHRGHKYVMKIAGPIMVLPLVPFALFPNFTVMMFLAPIFGFGYGVYLSASWALASDVVPEGGDEGKDMGIWQASWSSPQIFAGLSGWAIDGINKLHRGWGYSAAILVAALLFGVGSSMVQKVKGSK